MRRVRKALAAAAAGFASTLGASLWQAAAGSGVTQDEVAGSIALAVLAAIAAAGAVFGVKNAGQIDVATLTPDDVANLVRLGLISRDDAAAARGQKPA